MIQGVFGDNRHRIFLAKLVLDFIGHDGPAKTGPQNDNMRHESLLLLRQPYNTS